jgi:hypothetical protein
MFRKTKPPRPQDLRFIRNAVALAHEIAHGFAEDHEANIATEGRTMAKHRREEPTCSYCWMIREAKVLLRKEGRYDFTQR